ncbi:sulfate ABC transporter permease subunit CysT [Pusillimonas sp. TS35]|nr:sulfate ABC transporter permease subunit CysT [Paracandidimonas lactea]MYN12151.1 sulfate ABC transporter permease subunit CysT [Pusillimonas sp. TS35]
MTDMTTNTTSRSTGPDAVRRIGGRARGPASSHGGRAGVLPGFGLSMGFTVCYLSLLILIPLSTLPLRASDMGWDAFWAAATAPRVLASYRITFLSALIAALINTAFGVVVAWVLVRYRFPGRAIADALIDLPFALPTAVAGIALATLYAGNGWFGGLLEQALDWKVAYTPSGIVVALIFIGLPFVVRTVQPVLADLERDLEEAAASLGADRLRIVVNVILPAVRPAILTGFALAFARGIGEYGSVIFIAGNQPMVSEIAPLLIVSKLEQYDYEGAAAIATTMLVFSFLLLLAINTLQARQHRRPREARK